jgi:hypothetical protein
MSSFGHAPAEADGSRKVVYLVVGVATLILVFALLVLTTPLGVWMGLRSPAQPTAEPRLEGAIRPGSADYPAPDKLVVEFYPDQDASIGVTGIGTYAVRMSPTVRNFTGRTVTGLEFRAAGLDFGGNVIRERIAISNERIEPNRVGTPAVSINFPADGRPAQLKLELTGVRFE